MPLDQYDVSRLLNKTFPGSFAKRSDIDCYYVNEGTLAIDFQNLVSFNLAVALQVLLVCYGAPLNVKLCERAFRPYIVTWCCRRGPHLSTGDWEADGQTPCPAFQVS